MYIYIRMTFIVLVKRAHFICGSFKRDFFFLVCVLEPCECYCGWFLLYDAVVGREGFHNMQDNTRVTYKFAVQSRFQCVDEWMDVKADMDLIYHTSLIVIHSKIHIKTVISISDIPVRVKHHTHTLHHLRIRGAAKWAHIYENQVKKKSCAKKKEERTCPRLGCAQAHLHTVREAAAMINYYRPLGFCLQSSI